MESHNNHPPPFIPSPWDPPPPPPPPPPPNFQWGNPGFSHDVFPQFHPVHSPSHHSFSNSAGNFCPPIPHFPHKRKFDRADDGNVVKLYVCGIPRTVTEDEIYRLFEDYGNVMEVVLISDRRTGQQQEYCFVKYALIEEAERAITALHNQFTFSEAMIPIIVRYADGAKQRQGLERSMQHDSCFTRPGLMQNDSTFSRRAIVREDLHKLYVNGLNREASKQEIEEIFSSYGVVADIYIMRDESKQSRGCGFVGFSHRYMAVAAINGLNGSYVMKGCDKPLVVRFAEPKKPKNVDPRPTPNPVDMWGNNMSNALYLDNSSASMQFNPTVNQAGCFPMVANSGVECPVSGETQKPLQQPISPSPFSQMSLQHTQSFQGSPQASIQVDTQLQAPLHSNRTPVCTKEQQHDPQSPEPCRDTASNSVIVVSEPASSALSKSDVSEDSIDCEWSEHICPDGCKYYFNCATWESRWEKPEEFALYEQQLQRRQLQNHCCQESHPSAVEASFAEEDCQIKLTPNQSESNDYEKPHLATPCAVEHTNEQVQAETKTLGGPAFVQ